MSLTRNARTRDNRIDQRTAVGLVVALAVSALMANWLAIAEPVRSIIVFVCGMGAGISAIWVWMRGAHEENGTSHSAGDAGAEKALSWTDLAAAFPDPAIVLDAASAILNFNAPARALFDRLRVGLPLEHVIRDPELIAAVTGALETSEKRTARLAPRGVLAQRLIATVTPFGGDSRHDHSAVLVTLQDQSEQHRLLEMRTDFIANASHELRTPLASVRGFIETLQGPARNDAAARERFLAIMADQAERMTRLIDDLLLLSRVEEKANLKPTDRVDLDEVVEDVVRALAPAANERKIIITVDPAPSALIAAGDHDELFQVFHNLVENAVKYGRDNGEVRIALSKKRVARGGGTVERAVVTIADNGPGIAPEHLPRLTERFYRVNAEQSRRIGGTGLGLAIVKHVLTRHEGELHVESVVGTGTTFRVELPILNFTS